MIEILSFQIEHCFFSGDDISSVGIFLSDSKPACSSSESHKSGSI